jgi:hypothetical protein
MNRAAKFKAKYPQLDRDAGATVLDMVLENLLKPALLLQSNLDFIKDSLMCEWAYIVNLDTNKLEVYKGFQDKPHEKGRYASTAHREGYYPCALVAEFPLGRLPRFEAFLQQLDPPETKEGKE